MAVHGVPCKIRSGWNPFVNMEFHDGKISSVPLNH
jgi:hypothetical protein